MDENLAVGIHNFRNWLTIGVKSLAFRFEPEDSRTGIYILTFDDGYRYVGQSLSVVNRFAAHRRRWSDITHISFRPFMASELNTREREVLAAIESQGHRVRDIDLAGHPGGVSLLDIVMEEQAQVEWLQSMATEPGDSPRYLAASRRIAGLQRFQELMGRAGSQDLINAAANYVGSAIPWPSQTEGRFWTATAMATTGKRKDWRRLVTLSAQNAEVLVLGEVTSSAGTSVEGFINIDKNVTGIDSWIRDETKGPEAGVLKRDHPELGRCPHPGAAELFPECQDARSNIASGTSIGRRAPQVPCLHCKETKPLQCL